MNIELVDKNGLFEMLAKAGKEGVNATKQALNEEAQLMFRDSQKVVPVETGTLRRSGVLETAKEEGGRITVVIGYGGSASAYALRQHEDLSYKHAEGKQAKYLSEPVENRVNKLRQNLSRRIGRILSE